MEWQLHENAGYILDRGEIPDLAWIQIRLNRPNILSLSFTKISQNKEGFHYIITMSLEEMASLESEETKHKLVQHQTFCGEAVIGRLTKRRFLENAQSNLNQDEIIYWPILENESEVSGIVDHGVEIFRSASENYGKWPSFNDFLSSINAHDSRKVEPQNQVLLNYYWLIGSQKQKNVHKVGIYENEGVFILPESKTVPCFTSSLFACVAAHQYSVRYKVNLQIAPIHCLGCFLSGMSGELGKKKIKQAVLDNQWIIDFYSCDESNYKSARHFYLEDNGDRYVLAGCAETQGPFWAEAKWSDLNQDWFFPECMPRRMPK